MLAIVIHYALVDACRTDAEGIEAVAASHTPHWKTLLKREDGRRTHPSEC
jgi:hypothetical protein